MVSLFRYRRRGSQGLSLLELLIAFAILATGILFVIGTFPAGYAAVGKSRALLMATQAAQGYMDTEMARSFDEMALSQEATETRTMDVLGDSVDVNFYVEVTVTPQGSALSTSDTATVRVFVRWDQPGATPGGAGAVRYVRLETTRLREF